MRKLAPRARWPLAAAVLLAGVFFASYGTATALWPM
jgi:hypothetical protein